MDHQDIDRQDMDRQGPHNRASRSSVVDLATAIATMSGMTAHMVPKRASRLTDVADVEGSTELSIVTEVDNRRWRGPTEGGTILLLCYCSFMTLRSSA